MLSVETDGSTVCTWHFSGLMNSDGTGEKNWRITVGGVDYYPDLAQTGTIADVDMEYAVPLNPGDHWSYDPIALHCRPATGIIQGQSGICV